MPNVAFNNKPERGRWYNGTTLQDYPNAAKVAGFKRGRKCFLRKVSVQCISKQTLCFVEAIIEDCPCSHTFSVAEAREYFEFSGLAEDQEACDRLWKAGFDWIVT